MIFRRNKMKLWLILLLMATAMLSWKACTSTCESTVGKMVANTCGVPASGDLNGDCTIDFYDIAIIAENWLQEGAAA